MDVPDTHLLQFGRDHCGIVEPCVDQKDPNEQGGCRNALQARGYRWANEAQEHSSLLASSLLGSLAVFGTFNRITFPAFLLLPGLSLAPNFMRKPLTFLSLALSASLALLVAIQVDTSFFRPSSSPFGTLLQSPVLAPYNALVYNLSRRNLVLHGLHPRYQHLLINTPLLLGPVLPLLFRPIVSPLLVSAVSGLLALSILPHQEPRFLLPLVPLLLSSVRLPGNRARRIFVASWAVFNAVMGLLMGAFHQAGVVPMQLHLGNDAALPAGSRVLWWRTYSPPVWMADASPAELSTVDLMGTRAEDVWARIGSEAGACSRSPRDGELVLVAPDSAEELDEWQGRQEAVDGHAWRGKMELEWTRIWRTGRHIGLDNLDISGDGILQTLKKVTGGRGLSAWKINRRC